MDNWHTVADIDTLFRTASTVTITDTEWRRVRTLLRRLTLMDNRRRLAIHRRRKHKLSVSRKDTP